MEKRTYFATAAKIIGVSGIVCAAFQPLLPLFAWAVVICLAAFPVIVGALAIKATVRWINRRADPRRGKPPSILPDTLIKTND